VGIEILQTKATCYQLTPFC